MAPGKVIAGRKYVENIKHGRQVPGKVYSLRGRKPLLLAESSSLKSPPWDGRK